MINQAISTAPMAKTAMQSVRSRQSPLQLKSELGPQTVFFFLGPSEPAGATCPNACADERNSYVQYSQIHNPGGGTYNVLTLNTQTRSSAVCANLRSISKLKFMLSHLAARMRVRALVHISAAQCCKIPHMQQRDAGNPKHPSRKTKIQCPNRCRQACKLATW